MSLQWIAITVACFVGAFILGVLGYWLPHLLPFTENLFAEGIGLTVALGLAIIFIEGRFLTQQSRRRKILSKMAKSTLQEASEIGMMLTWELGTWMVSVFPTKVDLYGEDRGNNWDVDVKPLLNQVYAEAIGLDYLPYVDTLPHEDYRRWVEEGKSYAQRIRSRIQTNLDLHEYLLELVEAFDEFDSTLTERMWHTAVRTETERFNGLGQLGYGFVRVMETVGLIYSRLPEEALNERERARRRRIA